MTVAAPLPALRLFTTCDDRGPRDEVLIRLLDSLRRSSEQGADVHHYLLLQNCADPDASRIRLGLADEVRLISDSGQLSLSRARNILLDTFLGEAKADDIVAFPDDDAWYPENFAVWMAQEFGQNPDLDFLFCRYASSPASAETAPPARPASVMEVLKFASSNTLFARASRIRAVGHYDEDLGVGAVHGGGEDTDYGLRLRRLSRVMWFVDAALVGHRDKFAGLRGRYYQGGLAAIARNASSDPAVLLQMVRKLMVGGYLVLKREHGLGDWLSATRAAVAPSPRK